MIFLIAFFVLTLCFSFVLLFGAPYLPTQKKQVEVGLDLLDLKQGQTFYELGSGDGRVLKRAAERGYRCVGYELNPLLYIFSRIYTWKYRKKVKIIWSNFWKADLTDADGVFVFLLDKYMKKLDKKIISSKKPIRLVSFAFQVPGKKLVKESSGVFLYQY